MVANTDNRFRIGLISEEFPPSTGGIAQWAAGMATGLSEAGHDVTVICRDLRGDRLRSQFGDHPFTVKRVGRWKWREFRSIYGAWHLFIEQWRKRFDVILVSTWNMAAFAVFLRRFTRFKVIVAIHALEVTRDMSLKRKLKLRRVLSGSHLLLAVSDFTKEYVAEAYPEVADKLVTLHNGVDIRRFYPREPRADLIEKYQISGRRVILTLARVIPRKGHRTVIRALPELIGEFPDLVYLIAGGAKKGFKEELEALISELRLTDYVRFTDYIPDSDLADHYPLAEMYVMVSDTAHDAGDTEGFGITFLEANACGKAVIGSRSGGIVDAVEDGVNGLLVEPADPSDLARAIRSLLNDPDRRKQLEAQSMQRIEARFNWTTITTKFLNLVNTL